MGSGFGMGGMTSHASMPGGAMSRGGGSEGGLDEFARALGVPRLRDLLGNASFFLAPAAGEDGPGWLGSWSAWGETGGSRFGGQEGGLRIDGETTSATMGFDTRRDRWLAGVALSWNEGMGVYAGSESGTGGEVASTLVGLHPYARYEFSDRASVWGALGYGTGSLTLASGGAGEEAGTDLGHAMLALGGRSALTAFSGEYGDFELAVRSDARLQRTVSDAVPGLVGTAGATSRVRAVLEGSGALRLPGGGVLLPTLEAGLRHDGGDAETGAGVEVGAGLGYSSGRFTVEITARGLVAHEDAAYEEWGFGGAVSFTPRDDGRGLRLQLGSTWGAAQSGGERAVAARDGRGPGATGGRGVRASRPALPGRNRLRPRGPSRRRPVAALRRGGRGGPGRESLALGLPLYRRRTRGARPGNPAASGLRRRRRPRGTRPDADRADPMVSAVSVVVPVFREAANIEDLAHALDSALTAAGLQWELLLVDDDSRDGGDEVARRLARDFPVRFEIHGGKQRDLSLSVLQGLRSARFERIVVMDADLSHPPERIPDLLNALEQGVIAVGSRYASDGSLDPEWSPWRRLVSRAGTLLAAPLTACADPMSGFFAVDRRSLPEPGSLRPLGYKIGLELIVRGRLAGAGGADRFQGQAERNQQARLAPAIEIPAPFVAAVPLSFPPARTAEPLRTGRRQRIRRRRFLLAGTAMARTRASLGAIPFVLARGDVELALEPRLYFR